MFHNDGRGHFTDVSKEAGVDRGRAYGFTAVAADFDDDGWPDIYVACDSTPSFYYRNRRDGTFAEEGLERGVALSEDGAEQAGMGIGDRRLQAGWNARHFENALRRRHQRALRQQRKG